MINEEGLPEGALLLSSPAGGFRAECVRLAKAGGEALRRESAGHSRESGLEDALREPLAARQAPRFSADGFLSLRSGLWASYAASCQVYPDWRAG
jgi:hypothetical protein